MGKKREPRPIKKPRPVSEVHKPLPAGIISGNFDHDQQALRDVLRDCADLRCAVISTADNQKVALFFYAGLIDQEVCSQNVVQPLQEYTERLTTHSLVERVIKAPCRQTETSLENLATSLATGSVVLLTEGLDEALIVAIPQSHARGIERSQSEDVLIGPHHSFSEDINKNLALLRRFANSPALKIKTVELGRISKTDVAIIYFADVAQEKLVNEAEARLSRIDIDFIPGASYLIEFLEEKPFSILPQIKLTERPDRVLGALSEGRIAILAGGDPSCLVAPFFLAESLQSAEDYYEKPAVATLFRWLRLFSAALAVFLPGFWITLVSFHHGIIPPKLFSSIVAGRENVPFPTVIEAFLLLVAFDIVIEASTRLPTSVGQAVGIVGAIILGQSAVQASLISPSMTIVVALSGLASYTLPAPSMVGAIRVLKYLILCISSTLGMFGTVWALILFFIVATSTRSFGYPVMFPIAPFNGRGVLDILVKLPNTMLKQRPHFLAAENERRMTEESVGGKDDAHAAQNPDT